MPSLLGRRNLTEIAQIRKQLRAILTAIPDRPSISRTTRPCRHFPTTLTRSAPGVSGPAVGGLMADPMGLPMAMRR